VVRGAALAEPAVLPRDEHLAVRRDLGARERARAQAAGDAVEADPGHLDRAAPGRPAVVGAEGRDRAVQALERDDDAAARLHDRLAAEALVVPVRPDRRAPRQAAVGGRAHQLEVAVPEVVELGVAVTPEWAARVVVADGPVLV